MHGRGTYVHLFPGFSGIFQSRLCISCFLACIFYPSSFFFSDRVDTDVDLILLLMQETVGLSFSQSSLSLLLLWRSERYERNTNIYYCCFSIYHYSDRYVRTCSYSYSYSYYNRTESIPSSAKFRSAVAKK